MNVEIIDTLERILSYIDCIKSFKVQFGDDLEDFLTEPSYNMASTFALFQIGECVKTIEWWLKDNSTFSNWDEISRFRDFIAHRYQKVNNEIIWGVIRDDLYPLENEVKHLLSL